LKKTEIGLMPKDWELVKLKKIAQVNYGKSKPKDNGDIPVVGSSGTYEFTSEPLVNFPTIIIGRKGTAGKCWLYLEPCYPSDTTFYLSWKEKTDLIFLFEFLESHQLSGKHAKTTVPSLTRPDLENMGIPLPPLLEQQRIASILSAIDSKIEAEESKKKALQELFNSMLKELMTAKIRVNKLEIDLKIEPE
jgi:type I restriction enzyme S subunit